MSIVFFLSVTDKELCLTAVSERQEMCERRTKEVMDGEREICRIFIERQVVCLCPTFLQRSCQVDN